MEREVGELVKCGTHTNSGGKREPSAEGGGVTKKKKGNWARKTAVWEDTGVPTGKWRVKPNLKNIQFFGRIGKD